MIIKRIRKCNIIIGIILLFLISIIFRNVEYSLAYLLGFIASSINFHINYQFLSISKDKKIKFLGNPGLNYIFRLLVYCIVLALVLRSLSEYAVLFTFLGCLNIRLAIIVQQIYKGGGENELYQ